MSHPVASRPRRTLAVLDASVLAMITASTYAFLPLHDSVDNRVRVAHTLFEGLFAGVLLVLLYRDGQYSRMRRISPVLDGLSLGRSVVLAYLLVLAAAFVSKGFFIGFIDYSRLAVFLSMAVALSGLLTTRYVMWHRQRRLFTAGEALRKVALIGRGKAASDFADSLERRPWLGVRCVGTIGVGADVDARPESDMGKPMPLVGHMLDAARLFQEGRVDEFVVVLDPADYQLLGAVTETLAREGVPFGVVPALFEASYRPAKLAGFEELPVIDMEADSLDHLQRTSKRALDLTAAALMLVLGSPVLLGCALAVKLTSKGPVLFVQERVGRNGLHFQMFKFRTMVADAEEQLAELLVANEAGGCLFKIKDDPRMTRVGRFLRGWSLDELPQLVNVLKGDMSIVGPRPPLPREVEEYETMHFSRLRGTPGITGLWQVSGRSNLTFDEMIRLDRYYLENWSLGFDVSIMARTVYVMLARKGAC